MKQQIKPEAIMKIFDSDFDRDIMMEIIDVVEALILQKQSSIEKFVTELLRNISKIKRFKLVNKTLNKSDKSSKIR